MTGTVLSARCRIAAWLVTPTAWLLLVSGCVALVTAGPFALLLLPVALPPLLLVLVQARSGTRALRGRAQATVPLFVSCCLAAAALLSGAVIGLPGPVGTAPDFADIPRGVLSGVALTFAAALVQSVAAVLLWPTARLNVRISPVRMVLVGLCALAVAQVVSLTVAMPRG